MSVVINKDRRKHDIRYTNSISVSTESVSNSTISLTTTLPNLETPAGCQISFNIAEYLSNEIVDCTSYENS